MGAYAFRDITKLQTPVGSFMVISESGEPILFSVVRDKCTLPYEVEDESGKIIGKLVADANYCIVINSRNLEIGKIYKVIFTSGNWRFCDSDEHATCYNAIIDDWVVGIGAYDPNDEEKLDQAIAYSKQKGYWEQKFIMYPPKYDETKFTKYTVDALEDCNGYSFRIFDYSFDGIRFDVAWIETGAFPVDEYEGALGLWLC